MKFISVLIFFMIFLYFGVDLFLHQKIKSTLNSHSPNEKAMVQNMAKFLENSTDFQKRLSDNIPHTKQPIVIEQGKEEADLQALARYFGSKPADLFFKKFLIKKKKIAIENIDEQSLLFSEVTEYARKFPKEAADSLENALQSLPEEMKNEREALSSVFIHTAIHLIDDDSIDLSAKKTYLKRFINNTHDEMIKAALESRFPELIQ